MANDPPVRRPPLAWIGFARCRKRAPLPLGTTLCLVALAAVTALLPACGKQDPRAGDPLREGRASLARGDLTRAQALLRKAVDDSPRSEAARLALSAALVRAGNHREAERCLRDGLALLPRSIPMWVSLGRVLRQRGKYDQAVKALDRARRIDPQDPQPALALGEIYERYQKWEVARSHYQAALTGGRKDQRVLAHRSLARLARRQNRLTDAIDHLRQALRLEPRGGALYGELGEVLLQAGRPAEALVPLVRLAKLQPRNGEAQLRLGLSYRELGDHGSAVRALRKASKLLSSSAKPLLPLAQSLLAAGKLEEAYSVGVRGLALAPGDHDFLWLMAPLYAARKLYTPAAEALEKLRQVRAHDPEYWRLAGDVHTAQAQHGVASEEYARALTLRPRDRRLLRQAGFSARRAGKYLSARRHLQELLRLDPLDYDAAVHLAIAEEQLGQRGSASARLTRVARAKPGRPEAHLYLGWIALRQGAAARALLHATRADQLARGRSAHALDVLSGALLRLGRVAEAHRVVKRALALPLGKTDRQYFARLLQGKHPHSGMVR